MKDYREKRHKRRMLYSWPVIVILLFIVVFLSRSVWEVYQSERVAREKKIEAETERDKTLARKNELSFLVGHLSSERGMEEEIRKKFSVAKPEERVIVVVDPPKATTTMATATWWGKIWQKFGW